ncbi:DUF2927 domain-containing protein [Amylibacter marinus]|uniref:DUF2927 domain-containing protein n=1 Tax=Amylibacter marinus TaxID=1475483 RepID=UPI0024E0AA83|nr:DUF2927 domain-containing protein [Amylibacter marinus]
MSLLIGCAPIGAPISKTSQVHAPLIAHEFANPSHSTAIRRSNLDIASEFLDYSFGLETGATINQFSRFNGRIVVAFTQSAPLDLQRDLNKLVKRLQNEAGLNIVVGATGGPANIYINRITPRQLSSALPGAACFVVPNVRNLQELRTGRKTAATDWTQLDGRSVASIFLPNNHSPQEGRDCLHEELAQVLGPVNDLFRVADTIFNDDNMHVVLTNYDMLLLRLTYDSQLRNGMSRGDVAARLPEMLRRLNPTGEGYGTRPVPKANDAWKKAIFSALGKSGNASARMRHINRAVSIAQNQGYRDNLLAFSYFSRGHLQAKSNPEAAVADFTRAYGIYSRAYGSESIQAAQAAVQLASYTFTGGDVTGALALIEPSILAARRAQDATLLFRLLALKAAIKKHQNETIVANQLYREAHSWAYYALGTRPLVAQIFDRINSLAPPKG